MLVIENDMNRFALYMSFQRNMLLSLLLCGALELRAEDSTLAHDITRAGRDSWHWSGFFCFASGTKEETRLHLAEFDGNSIRTAFTIGVSNTLLFSPVCLPDGVVVVDIAGMVAKIGLEGEFIFKSKPPAFEGTPSWSGKVTETRIFVSETVWDEKKRGWRYQLHVLDVAGKAPASVGKYNIIQPVKIVVTSTSIVIIGERRTQRLKISNK